MENHYMFKSGHFIYLVPFGVAQIVLDAYRKTTSLEIKNFQQLRTINFIEIYQKLTQEQKESILRVEDLAEGIHPLHKLNF